MKTPLNKMSAHGPSVPDTMPPAITCESGHDTKFNPDAKLDPMVSGERVQNETTHTRNGCEHVSTIIPRVLADILARQKRKDTKS